MFGWLVRRSMVRVLVVVAVWVSSAAVLHACPGCADGQAGQGTERANIVNGYFWSIVFMMSMPFLLLGSFGTYCYLQMRKARAAREAATPSVPTTRPTPRRADDSSGPELSGPGVFTGG